MIVYAIPYFFSRHSFPLCLKVVPIEYFQLQTGQISSITILYSVLLIVISVYYQMVYANSEKLLLYLLGILSLDFSRLFLCPFQKSPHFLHLFSQKYLTNGSKNVALRALIKKGYPARHRRLYSFEMEAFLCYPFTHRIHIPIIRTSLFLIF